MQLSEQSKDFEQRKDLKYFETRKSESGKDFRFFNSALTTSEKKSYQEGCLGCRHCGNYFEFEIVTEYGYSD